MANLKPGARGIEVRHWRRFLTKQKLLPLVSRKSALVELIFDESTLKATIAFQRSCGLDQTGEVDAATLREAQKAGFDPHLLEGDSGATDSILLSRAKDIVDQHYTAARTAAFQSDVQFNNKPIPGPDHAFMILLAAKFVPDDAAMVAALWSKESDFSLNPYGDAGPAQLTSWWLWNEPELIVGDAYGSWNGRICEPDKKKQPPCKPGERFDGNAFQNVLTLGNIVRNYRRSKTSDKNIPLQYNSNADMKERGKYGNEVSALYVKYKIFFHALLTERDHEN